MKTKLKNISFLLFMLLLAAMTCIDLFKLESRAGALIVIPKISGGGIPLKTLEEVNENKLMLTYENLYDKRIEAMQSTFSVVMKGTNHTYTYVMDYSIVSGGFFTKEEQENKNKVAVLNKKAAFDIFGSLDAVGNEIRVDGTPYIVNGVIDDRDEENLNAYAPAACFAGTAASVAAGLKEPVTPEHALTELKNMGINEMKYDFLNLKTVQKVTKDKAILAFGIVALGFLLLGIKKSAGWAFDNLKEIGIKRQRLYFKEILKSESKPVQKLVFLVIVQGCMVGSEVLLFLSMFEKLLEWYSLKGLFNNVSYTCFASAITRTESWYMLTNFLFAGFFVFFTVFVMLSWE